MIRSKLNLWGSLLVGIAIFGGDVLAAPAGRKPARRPAAEAKKAPNAKGAPAGFRKKELNFEERVIEGLSNRGYESLSQTGSNDGLKGEKLYRKRAEFDEDSKSLLREMEYLK